MIGVLDAEGTQVVVAASQSPLDRSVPHLDDRYLGHPLLLPNIVRRGFTAG